jgi:hypothetical protein
MVCGGLGRVHEDEGERGMGAGSDPADKRKNVCMPEGLWTCG